MIYKILGALLGFGVASAVSSKKYARGGGVRKPRLKKGDSVYIYGKTWFQKSYGNTYHITKVYVNDKVIGISEQEYGYGEHYVQTGMQILWENYLPPYNFKTSMSYWRLRDFGIKIHTEETEVSRERDLHHTSYAKGGSTYTKGGEGGTYFVNFYDGADESGGNNLGRAKVEAKDLDSALMLAESDFEERESEKASEYREGGNYLQVKTPKGTLLYSDNDGWTDTQLTPVNEIERYNEFAKGGLTEKEKLDEAIKHFEDKIKKQGRITNARDEEHLSRLKNQQRND